MVHPNQKSPVEGAYIIHARSLIAARYMAERGLEDAKREEMLCAAAMNKVGVSEFDFKNFLGSFHAKLDRPWLPRIGVRRLYDAIGTDIFDVVTVDEAKVFALIGDRAALMRENYLGPLSVVITKL